MAGGVRTEDRDGRLKFQYGLFVVTATGGLLNVGDIEDCDHPTQEVDVAERKPAGRNHAVKKPGMYKCEPIKVRKIRPASFADKTISTWFYQAANPKTGKAIATPALKRDAKLVHYNDAGVEIESWILKGAWCSKLEGEKNEGSSDHSFESFTLVFDYVEEPGAQ